LSTGRFTCVCREDDRATRWVAGNWRAPNAADPDLWFAMSVARFVNQPATLARIGYPVPWDPENFLAVMSIPNPGGETLYNPAYMIRSTSSYKGRPKAEYLVEKQFNPYWARCEWLRPRVAETLAEYHARLRTAYGMSDFTAAQVVADLKYVKPLLDAPDWWTFGAPGPGSLKGLNAILGLAPITRWTNGAWLAKTGAWLAKTKELYKANASRLGAAGVPRLHMQDVQNLECEVSKVARGWAKTGYTPSAACLLANESQVRVRLREVTDDANRRLAAAGIEARYTPDPDAFVAIWRQLQRKTGRRATLHSERS
jgi:hypothetical protein